MPTVYRQNLKKQVAACVSARFQACTMTVRTENCAFNMQQTVGELPVMDRAWAWFVVNRKRVLWGGAALVVVVVAVAIYFWRMLAVEVSASEALSRVEAQFAVPGAARNESA